ncbi:hypothetical protein V5L74_003271 [Enterobacter hormaechei]
MKTQASIQKCPSTGSVKSTGKSVIKVSIQKLNEISTESRYPLFTGLIKALNKVTALLTFNKRYFILLSSRRDGFYPVSGYAVIDALSQVNAIKLVREILNISSAYGYGTYHITLAVRVSKGVRDLNTFATFCNAEWIIKEVEYDEAYRITSTNSGYRRYRP